MNRSRRTIVAVGGWFCGAFLIGVMHRNADDARFHRSAVASPPTERATWAEPRKGGDPLSPFAARDALIVSHVGAPPADWGVDVGLHLSPGLLLDAIDHMYPPRPTHPTNPPARETSERGEPGEYHTPQAFLAEAERISGFAADPNDPEQCRHAAYVYLRYYAPRVNAQTREQLRELYLRGAPAYRQWARNRSAENASPAAGPPFAPFLFPCYPDDCR